MGALLVTEIPHKEQRYDTAGDYQKSVTGWNLTVSQMPDKRYTWLLIIHELVEMMLTKNDGVDWDDIDEFDMYGEGCNHPDPGTLKSAPYHVQHMRATDIEKLMAHFLGVKWEEYIEALDALEY